MANLPRCSLICFLPCFFITSLSLHHGGNAVEFKVLNVGEELERESLPLGAGRRIYRIHGLEESVWYEVKISCPASIPASFSIQLNRNAPEFWLGKNRRLLNTEKLVFKADRYDPDSPENEIYVLVTVEAAGVIAKPRVQEREVVVFNIVCDELSYGIPHKAWKVGIAAFLCLVLASVLPYFLVLQLLLKIGSSLPSNQAVTKSS